MPLPKPIGSEDEQAYVSRCMEAQKGEDKDQKQKLAICYSTYGEAKKARLVEANVLKAAEAGGLAHEQAMQVAGEAVKKYYRSRKTQVLKSLDGALKSLQVRHYR